MSVPTQFLHLERVDIDLQFLQKLREDEDDDDAFCLEATLDDESRLRRRLHISTFLGIWRNWSK